ncbi:MAG: gliding motility lipoprotein GldH [Bacteroidaceae bacterium]|nr:gliding motility lipoprotein GldH [Bacteroidaceae bacterium]
MMRRALWFSMGLFLAACNKSTLLHSYKPLPLEGWDRRDTICFDLPQVQKDIDATLYIGLRTKAYIGIQNVALAVELTDETAGICLCDTVHYPLTDAEGYTLTRGVNTHQYETQQLPFYLKKGEQGTIRIHHLMANETLTGITEVGIKIETK